MRFVFPTQEYEQRAADYINEFHEYSSAINGTGGLDRYVKQNAYSGWLVKVASDADIANIPKDKVPSFTYFYVREDDDKIIGMINIRLALSEFLRSEGGHIGYSVRPTERGKGYGTRILREALGFFKPIVNTDIFVSCDKSNIASAKVIQNCGGILDKEFYSEYFGEIIQRYIIRQAVQTP